MPDVPSRQADPKPQGRDATTEKRAQTALDRAVLRRKSRLFGYEFAVLLCELLPRYQPVFGSDFAKLLIVHAVAAANVRRLMAQPEADAYGSMAEVVPADLQVPANSLSIAESTGIPRETVRRKIKELVRDGILTEDARGGYRLRPGVVQSEALPEVYENHLQAIVALVNRCLDAGILRLEETPGGPALAAPPRAPAKVAGDRGSE
jgi:hypothetical protein